MLDAVAALAPWGLAEDWDNVGLLVGRPDRSVRRVLVALDLREAVLAEAAARDCRAVLTHHPVIFGGLPALTPATAAGRLVLGAAEEGIAVIAAHTNLDSARGGLNDLLAAALGLEGCRPLAPADDDRLVGLGRIGDGGGVTIAELVSRCTALTGVAVRHTGAGDRIVNTVACCTGSGGSLIAAASAAGAEAYVTGDLRYHDADAAGAMALIDATHAGVEAALLARWVEIAAPRFAALGVELCHAAQTTDPWKMVVGR